jgi:hypothetical protein
MLVLLDLGLLMGRNLLGSQSHQGLAVITECGSNIPRTYNVLFDQLVELLVNRTLGLGAPFLFNRPGNMLK